MTELKIDVLLEEIKRIRSIRLDEIRDVETKESNQWFYLEGAITTLTDLMYSYYIAKEGGK